MKKHGGNSDPCCSVKEAGLKGYILYDSNRVTFWKRQRIGSRNMSGCQGTGWRKGSWYEEMENGIFLGWRNDFV